MSRNSDGGVIWEIEVEAVDNDERRVLIRFDRPVKEVSLIAKAAYDIALVLKARALEAGARR